MQKSPYDYLRPGLASLSPRPSQVQRTDTAWEVPCPGREFPAGSARQLLPGSDLDGSSIALRFCPNWL